MRIFFIVIFSGFIFVLAGQDTLTSHFNDAENELAILFGKLYSANDSTDRDKLLEIISMKFKGALLKEGSFEYSWTKLDKIGKITSTDNMLKIFTWHYQIDADHYAYYGFIQARMKGDQIDVFELTDNRIDRQTRETLDQSIESWHGKLYYGIIAKTYKRNTFYTVLGMDYNNSMSTIKTIEVLSIKRNRPVFEEGLFFDGKNKKDRIVLEYSSQVAISVRYNKQLDQIVFDHLVPLHPVYSGNYEFYGPDGSYDGIMFGDGMWIYLEDVDARNLY